MESTPMYMGLRTYRYAPATISSRGGSTGAGVPPPPISHRGTSTTTVPGTTTVNSSVFSSGMRPSIPPAPPTRNAKGSRGFGGPSKPCDRLRELSSVLDPEVVVVRSDDPYQPRLREGVRQILAHRERHDLVAIAVDDQHWDGDRVGRPAGVESVAHQPRRKERKHPARELGHRGERGDEHELRRVPSCGELRRDSRAERLTLQDQPLRRDMEGLARVDERLPSSRDQRELGGRSSCETVTGVFDGKDAEAPRAHRRNHRSQIRQLLALPWKCTTTGASPAGGDQSATV